MYVIVIYLFLIALCMWDSFSRKKIEKKNQIYILIGILVFFAFRFGMGSDTRTYVDMYEGLTNNVIHATLETNRYPLFNFIQAVLINCGLSFPEYLLLIQVIAVSVLGYTVYKESNNILLSIVVIVGSGFIESYMTSMVRQMICMSFFAFAFFRYLKYDKYLKYYAIVIPLCLMHWVCYILLFIPIIRKFSNYFLNKKTIVLLFVLAVIFSVITSGGFDIVLNYFPDYMAELFSSDARYFQLSSFVLRIILFGLVLGLYQLSDKDKINNFDKFQIYVCYLSFLLYIALMNYSVAVRACDFLEIIHIILIPKLISNIRNKEKVMVGLSIVFIINLVLIVADIKFNVEYWYYNKSIIDYPYVSLLKPDDSLKYYEFYNTPNFIEKCK